MIKWNRKLRRLLSMLLAWTMIFTLVQGNVYAATESSSAESSLTECHKEHDADCGYKEELIGSGCTHVHDGDCGYKEGTPGSPCEWIPDENGGGGGQTRHPHPMHSPASTYMMKTAAM